MIRNVLKRTKKLSGFYTGCSIVLMLAIVSSTSSQFAISNIAVQIIAGVTSFVAFILNIVSAVKGFKYYSWVGNIEDDLPQKKSKKITQSLKSVCLVAAILDCLTIIGVGIFSIIPKIIFIFKTKSLEQRISRVKKK